MFACFVVYEKAFNRIQHNKLIKPLQEVDVDGKDERLIKNQYWRKQAEVTIGNSSTGRMEIRRAVGQGCILSPVLFNHYVDRIFKETVEDLELQ